jgi:hypothetical protein
MLATTTHLSQTQYAQALAALHRSAFEGTMFGICSLIIGVLLIRWGRSVCAEFRWENDRKWRRGLELIWTGWALLASTSVLMVCMFGMMFTIEQATKLHIHG